MEDLILNLTVNWSMKYLVLDVLAFEAPVALSPFRCD